MNRDGRVAPGHDGNRGGVYPPVARFAGDRMPKAKQRQRKETKPDARRAPATKHPVRAPAEPVEAQRPARSQAMRLVAEVERLERELAAARAQMAALAAHAEI